MACRRLVELPKVAFRRRYLKPLVGSSSHLTCAHSANAMLTFTQSRCASDAQNMPVVPEIKVNLIQKIRRSFHLPDYSKSFYKTMGVYIYEKIDTLNINQIMTEFELEDTFYSWFLIIELHVWILMSRASQHGKEGRLVKDSVAEAMWDDVKRRIKLLVPNLPSSEQTKALKQLDGGIEFALILYDEAVLSDDRRLAEALWIRLYRGKTVDPIVLEKFVCYVRMQIRHLDLTPREKIILRANFSWLPVKKCRI